MHKYLSIHINSSLWGGGGKEKGEEKGREEEGERGEVVEGEKGDKGKRERERERERRETSLTPMAKTVPFDSRETKEGIHLEGKEW